MDLIKKNIGYFDNSDNTLKVSRIIKKYVLWIILSGTFLLSGAACNLVKQNRTMKIFHLQPNRITVNTEAENNGDWFEQEREDFFALQNFEVNSEAHKAEVDSFVINYIRKDNFLNTNQQVSWSLVFFKYGDGITENTPHEFDTDYSMHELFAFKKRLVYYYFTGNNGYENTGYYLNGGETIKEEKRDALRIFMN